MLQFPKPRFFPHSKPDRLPRRKRVTLIASFPASSGFAICADSQETVTEHDPEIGSYEVRVTVQKITQVTAGKYQIAICGAGNGTLIESFIVRAERALKDEDAIVCTPESPASVSAIHRRLESELQSFYANDVALYPGEDKTVRLFVAASCPIAQECALWVSENLVLREARRDGPELNGWDHRLYIETAKRLFRPDMKINQAALASMYTLTIARDSSNWVRDPLSVAIVSKDGIWKEEEDYVRKMENRLRDYESRINNLFLACSDTTVSLPALEDHLKEFKETALALHKEHIDRQAQSMSLEGLLKGRPQRKLPQGPVYWGLKGLTVEHDREKIADSKKKFEFARILGGAGPVVVTIRCQCTRSFEREFLNHKTAFGSTVTCECGESKILIELGSDEIRLKNPRPLGAHG
jgi:hypothetical protein